MLRKYLVLGIMMGALALTGCGAEEKKDNDKDEVKATQEAEKEEENVTTDDEGKDVEENQTSNDEDSQVETEPTEGLLYISDDNEYKVVEWHVPASKTKKDIYYYGPVTGPKSSCGDYYLGYYTRMHVTYDLELTEDATLKDALINNYKSFAYNFDIDTGTNGYIEDVEGEYVTVNGVECYKYTGTAGNGFGLKYYVSGYIFDCEGYKCAIQCQFTDNVDTEEQKEIAKKEIENNLEVAMKGFRVE